MAQETQTWALHQSRGGRIGRKIGERFEREEIYIYLWLIHIKV